jgi:hypothetical protein
MSQLHNPEAEVTTPFFAIWMRKKNSAFGPVEKLFIFLFTSSGKVLS